jgi:hypothetical protein
MNYSYLHIELSNNLNLNLNLKFRLLDNPLTELWLDRMSYRDQYLLDHPDRFYRFDTLDVEVSRATKMITNCIDVINSYQVIITKSFTNIYDQDCLNYLHNIFEKYHGLLDAQDTDYWNNAPLDVRQSLAELNLAVHRCELLTSSVARPRFVCTWFGLPKTKTLPSGIMKQYGTLSQEFGNVYINYVEIGKTLADLAHDNDNYIADDAFKPFNFYSADFVVRFYSDSKQQLDDKLQQMEQYFNNHNDFFQSRGYNTFADEKLQPLHLPVAELIETMPRDQLIKEIQQHQCISKVYFT